MNRRPRPTFVLALCIALIAQSVGCSSSGSTADPPAQAMEYFPTRDALETLETCTKVTVVLQNGSIVRGWYEGMENLPPRRVYAVPPTAFPQVADSLGEWTPVQGEPIVIYKYPSHEVYEETRTDLAVWGGDLRSRHPNVYLMTPQSTGDTKFTVRIRHIPHYGTFTHVAALPSDSISIIHTDTEEPRSAPTHAANVIGAVAVWALAVCVFGAIAMASGHSWGFGP